MVFFSCNNCGEASKKNQVERHMYICKFATFSCIDCQLVFTKDTYKDHVKCITENQKYGGKNYVEKENKGEVKQNAWVDQVNRAIELVVDPQVKELLKSVAGFANIPRKEAKFINFLKNSFRLRDNSLAVRAWQAIAAEAEKMRQEAIKKQAEVQKAERVEKKEAANRKIEEKNNKKEEKKDEDETTTTVETSNFKWKKAIKRKLKENGGEMKMKKLKKAILEEYPNGEEENFDELFEEKLKKCPVRVEGKKVVLESS
ncbi:unnamed protein product [Caenorhabditis bovis]|uniref:Zinc finger C2H2 LYAR-type domain-containing protein n=1 Tax=Caenorhabditis bovis TaxID=2654633 RepID=A0A8S1EM55_9PELO|nr:unnamed protein product [Caenorhabditis bovis]